MKSSVEIIARWPYKIITAGYYVTVLHPPFTLHGGKKEEREEGERNAMGPAAAWERNLASHHARRQHQHTCQHACERICLQ